MSIGRLTETRWYSAPLTFRACRFTSLTSESKRVSTLPGSNGIFSPRWSPDGRYVAGIDSESISKLMVFDYITQKWTEVFGSEIGYFSWSHDGKYILLPGFA